MAGFPVIGQEIRSCTLWEFRTAWRWVPVTHTWTSHSIPRLSQDADPTPTVRVLSMTQDGGSHQTLQRADPGRDRQVSVLGVCSFQPRVAGSPASHKASASQMTSAQLGPSHCPLQGFFLLYLTLLQTQPQPHASFSLVLTSHPTLGLKN